MGKKKSRALTFKWNDTAVGNIISLRLNVSGEVIDVSDFDSGDWTEKMAGVKDWTAEVEVNHNPEDDIAQGELEEDMFSSDREGTGEFGPETPQDGDVSITGEMILSDYSINASGRDDVVTSSFSLEGNGPATRNVETTA